MKALRSLAVICALFGVAPLAANAQSVVVDDSFAGGKIDWSDRGSMYVRWRPVVSAGTVFICGVRANMSSSSRTARLNRALLRDASIMQGDQRVIQGLDYFATANSGHVSAKLVGQSSNCRATSLNADAPLSSMKLVFRKGRYRP